MKVFMAAIEGTWLLRESVRAVEGRGSGSWMLVRLSWTIWRLLWRGGGKDGCWQGRRQRGCCSLRAIEGMKEVQRGSVQCRAERGSVLVVGGERCGGFHDRSARATRHLVGWRRIPWS